MDDWPGVLQVYRYSAGMTWSSLSPAKESWNRLIDIQILRLLFFFILFPLFFLSDQIIVKASAILLVMYIL